jgi:hypothetical protein
MGSDERWRNEQTFSHRQRQVCEAVVCQFSAASFMFHSIRANTVFLTEQAEACGCKVLVDEVSARSLLKRISQTCVS